MEHPPIKELLEALKDKNESNWVLATKILWKIWVIQKG